MHLLGYIVGICAVLLVSLQTAEAQKATITGSEPPSRASKAAPAKSLSGLKITPDKLSGKIREISMKLAKFKNMISIGNNVLQKWAGTAEMFEGYAKAHQESALACRLSKAKLQEREESGASSLLLADLREEAKTCEIETARSMKRLAQFDQQLKSVELAVNQTETDVAEYSRMANDKTKEIAKLEIERSLEKKLNEVNDAMKQFGTGGL